MSETIDEKLDRLLAYALERDVCLKVLISGVCGHSDNRFNRMHTCCLDLDHKDKWLHRCVCGKQWCEITRAHVCPVLTDEQFAVVAFTKAVE